MNLDLALALIACPSITPHDAGCQVRLNQHLSRIGFICEALPFGKVSNLWARYGTQGPLLVFLGHTDVVPTGPLEEWTSPPFEPQIRDGYLYGRGAADMKTGLAAMVDAAERFINRSPNFTGSIAFLITSDEEADGIDGTQKVVGVLQERGVHIDYCLVGEPSSAVKVGDQIRIGRRGSLHGTLRIHGKQGHVAHPQFAENPIHRAASALSALAANTWDEGNQHFPATTFQITNMHAGTGALNVIPGHLDVNLNFRFGTASTVESLQARTTAILQQHHLTYDLQWHIGGEPFLTTQPTLINHVQRAIKKITQQETKLSTGGGTSDGRFIAPTGAEVVELGVSHATAHQIDEHVAVKDIEILSDIYHELLQSLFDPSAQSISERDYMTNKS